MGCQEFIIGYLSLISHSRDSCDRYLKSLEPIVSEEMLEQTKALVEDFLEERGPVLQEDLKKLDEENKKGSWLSGYWEGTPWIFFF